MLQVRNPDYRRVVYEGFVRAAFVAEVGIKFSDCGPGWCEAILVPERRHGQHGGLVHAGALATLAEHCAVAAATTLLDVDAFVVSAEFKLTLIRPAAGKQLRCRAEVQRVGRALGFVEARIFAQRESDEHLVASASVTLGVEAR